MENKNLHFITGLMGAGKTKQLIDYLTDLSKNTKTEKIWLFAGSLDLYSASFKLARITSRDGREVTAIPINSKEGVVFLNVYFSRIKENSTVLIDEAQFLTPDQMEIIIEWTKIKNLNTKIYGLDRDFKNEQFPAITTLIKARPKIEFIVTECQMPDCLDYAENNARIIDGHVVTDGDTFLEAKSSYLSICDKCFEKMTLK